MSDKTADVISKETSKEDAAEIDALYHVRLIHNWALSELSSSIDLSVISSFYGLQLELRGRMKGHHDSLLVSEASGPLNESSPFNETTQLASALLHFGSPPSSAMLESLHTITGPMDVIVCAKVPISNAFLNKDGQAALQQMSIVQVENSLVEINGKRLFDDHEATGADIYHHLSIVASRASLASPFELTMRRHDLALVSSKIVPFAQRKDVQEAQVAQLATLIAQDAALPRKIRHKKLFLIQQLDYEREYYLVPHVSTPLQQLHAQLMDSCQWQSYEFSKTMWYFYAPTLRLCAEHPFRSHPEARELIHRVQERIQEAVGKLQRKIRGLQRRKRFRSIVQQEKQQHYAKQRDRRLQTAVRRLQHRFRAFQCRKRRLAIMEIEIRRQEDVRRQEEVMREREEEKRQLKDLRVEQQRLQQELDEAKEELRRMRETTRDQVDSKPQASESREKPLHDVIEEQRRLQERLERLEMEVQVRNESKLYFEKETQTSARQGDVFQCQSGKQEERMKKVPAFVEVASTSARCSHPDIKVRAKGVMTGDDSEWQQHLTLLRESIKHKRHLPEKHQLASGMNDQLLVGSSMLQVARTPSLFASDEWKDLAALQRGRNFASPGNGSKLYTLKMTANASHALDTLSSPPFRTLESFFAPESHRQSPPSFVGHSWRNGGAQMLPSSHKILQGAHGRAQPSYPAPSCTMETTSSTSNTTGKLPYIIRRY